MPKLSQILCEKGKNSKTNLVKINDIS